MTLFDLVIRSMRKNIKHYYLYFFALILSVVLYFVFATLQYDTAVIGKTEESMNMDSAFKAAGILLIFIAGIFVVYANAIFLKRRSREIGLYQLIGLTKGAVARLLIIENALLGIGALVIGIGTGLLVSRVFLLLLMKLVGYEGFIELSFSMAAIIQTAFVFVAIIALTSAQMLYAVYRSTLLGLFNADKKGEHPKKPRTFVSAVLALLGIGLVVFGYWLSGNMMNALVFFNMLAVLASTILGTYLIFRVTISWLFYQIRMRKKGHLGLNNSLSLAPLMHRMKGNANSLTIITVLSAMTLAMLAGAYSLYYSTEKETRFAMPFDFMFETGEDEAKQFTQKLAEQDITFTESGVETLWTDGIIDTDAAPEWLETMMRVRVISAGQLQDAGLAIETPTTKTASFHDSSLVWLLKTMKMPFDIVLSSGENEVRMQVSEVGQGNVVNFPFSGSQLVVEDAVYQQLKNTLPAVGVIGHEKHLETMYVVNVEDDENLAAASEIFQHLKDDNHSFDFYSMYTRSMQSNGLLIFIAGFLGLVFLISTGSILYFKQMTEAEQEKQSYATLRQLGFTVQEIMRGVIRKQVFVFGMPLLIGLFHSVFAIKAASFMFMSDITVPTSIAMGIYAMIYLMFAFLTVGYYRKTVKTAF
ncbi:FtsX-like permease family protein [Sporosarcina sp. ANT_H38]|uniref:FtsX-like permease family protein n=1 Tax=Sporosarcina sp. ANT_H38 TaxID=2597358 RepID=UPI0011F15B8B|nr:FtsX-like permease family protein [Sporosarcina sp. ANT_H38]KAA0955797.1 FtsX-like permease family protein [Sporosarcina sp. ANT_H38]